MYKVGGCFFYIYIVYNLYYAYCKMHKNSEIDVLETLKITHFASHDIIMKPKHLKNTK